LSSPARGKVILCAATVLLALGAGVYVYVADGRSGADPRVGQGPRTDAPAPEFELQSLDGGPISLASLRGKVVYVNLWATWCAPCKEEAPALQELYEQLHGSGFEIVAATIDTADSLAAIRKFKDDFKIGFPILLDPDKKAYQAYGATGVPETYLIDAEGRLVEAYIGPRDWRDPKYARAIQRVLDARGSS